MGKPWRANARGPEEFDCWHLAAYIEQKLFRRALPDIEIPSEPTWKWMIDQFSSHVERRNWEENKYAPNQLITANDGAIVLMARNRNPAHCGIWLQQEQRIIHCSQDFGVVCDDIMTLRANGWAKLRFYEPKVSQ